MVEGPKATLLREPWQTYTLAYGKSTFNFIGGVPTPVPHAVALELKKKRHDDGSDLFKIEGLNVVAVSSAPVQSLAESQNVHGTHNVTQTRFAAWL